MLCVGVVSLKVSTVSNLENMMNAVEKLGESTNHLTHCLKGLKVKKNWRGQLVIDSKCYATFQTRTVNVIKSLVEHMGAVQKVADDQRAAGQKWGKRVRELDARAESIEALEKKINIRFAELEAYEIKKDAEVEAFLEAKGLIEEREDRCNQIGIAQGKERQELDKTHEAQNNRAQYLKDKRENLRAEQDAFDEVKQDISEKIEALKELVTDEV